MRVLRTIINHLRLIRAVNCLIAACGVAVGAYLTSPQWLTFDVVITGLAVFFVCAGGNVLNDVRDMAIDRISHPERVLVRGQISGPAAVVLACVLPAFGLALACIVNVQVMAIGAIGTLLTFSYDFWLKRVPLLGNLAVAVCAGLTFLIGGAAASPDQWLQLPGPIIPSVFAVLFHLVREIVKDVEDMEGDLRAQIRTLPGRIGAKPALMAALLVMSILVILTWVPFLASWFGLRYLILGVGLAELPSLISLALSIKRPDTGRLRQTSTVLKIGMILGLVALVVG